MEGDVQKASYAGKDIPLAYEFLIVDDSAIMRETVTDFAEDMAHNVIAVENGMKALEILRQRAFDLIFLDIYMPEMDGIETFKKIRELNPKQKVVFMTSDRDEDVFGRAVDPSMRCSGFINKPFTAAVFKTCIKTVLELKGTFSHKKEGLY